ncbi:MAG: 3-phosphoshikimate 1-carboxyvinyltransferase [Actinomycetota bacterium]|nr:3-phosphoshikimate 1-carboxyvinyltransferase [Actinomycetota bacterium]
MRGLNSGADVRATLAAVEALGVRVAYDDNYQVQVYGEGMGGLREPGGPIDAGNSGTTVRTMLGVAAAIEGLTVFIGDRSLSERPMLRVVAPLRQMGARIDGRANGELLPLVVRGGALRGVDIELSVASAQVKTALLFAGCLATGTTSVIEPGPSRDHTERMLSAAGVAVVRSGTTVSVDGPQLPAPLNVRVPGDMSSAAFLIVAALLVEGSDLTIEDVGINPTRTGLIDALRAMGADIEVIETGTEGGEPVGSIRVRSSALVGASPDPAAVPTFIDEIPVLAIAATQAEGETTIRGASELRVKETDRISALVEGITAIGGRAEAHPDGMTVTGSTPLRGADVDSLGDHRVAMAFAVAGLVADDNIRIAKWSCVDTSFPEFLDVLGRAQGRLTA